MIRPTVDIAIVDQICDLKVGTSTKIDLPSNDSHRQHLFVSRRGSKSLVIHGTDKETTTLHEDCMYPFFELTRTLIGRGEWVTLNVQFFPDD